MPYKQIVKEVVVLLGLSLVTALAVNFISPRGIAWFGQWNPERGVITANPADGLVDHGIEINDLSLAKMDYDRGEVVFVDARSAEIYSDGHIKGAVSLPLERFDSDIAEFLEKYPFSTVIIAYCSGRECEQSHELAQLLIEAGYTHVRVLSDGFPGWRDAGYPIE